MGAVPGPAGGEDADEQGAAEAEAEAEAAEERETIDDADRDEGSDAAIERGASVGVLVGIERGASVGESVGETADAAANELAGEGGDPPAPCSDSLPRGCSHGLGLGLDLDLDLASRLASGGAESVAGLANPAIGMDIECGKKAKVKFGWSGGGDFAASLGP